MDLVLIGTFETASRAEAAVEQMADGDVGRELGAGHARF